MACRKRLARAWPRGAQTQARPLLGPLATQLLHHGWTPDCLWPKDEDIQLAVISGLSPAELFGMIFRWKDAVLPAPQPPPAPAIVECPLVRLAWRAVHRAHDKYFVAHKLRLVAEARRLAFEGASTGSLKTVARRLAKEEFGLLSQDDKDTFFAEVAGCPNIPRAGHFKRGLEALTDQTLLVDIPVPSPTKRCRSLNAKLIAIGSSFVDQLRRLGCDSACDSGSVGKDKQLRVQLARLRAAVALQSGADELQSSILCTQAPKGVCLETLFFRDTEGGYKSMGRHLQGGRPEVVGHCAARDYEKSQAARADSIWCLWPEGGQTCNHAPDCHSRSPLEAHVCYLQVGCQVSRCSVEFEKQHQQHTCSRP